MASTAAAWPPETAAREAANPSARRTFRMLHLILGLSFGLLLAAQGLSGAVLVWRPELDRLMLPALTHAPAGNEAGSGRGLDRGYATALAAAPGGAVRMVRLPSAATGTEEWMVQLPAAARGAGAEGPRWTVYTAPGTGALLGIRGQRRDALEWLIELHHNLLWGRTGRAIQGYLAIATMLLALSGLWLWWPARWTASRFRPRAAARPLHYALGFWAMWPLLLIATTATYFVWRQPMQRAFGVAEATRAGAADRERLLRPDHAGPDHGRGKDAGRSAGRHRSGAPGQGGATEGPAVAPGLDAVVNAAHAAQPEARLTTVRFSAGGRGPYVVAFESAREHYRAAPNVMVVQVGPDGNATVMRTTWWRDLPLRRRALEWLPRIHQGEFGGPVIRALWSLTGMCPAVLFVSGLLMWRRRLRAGS